MPGSLPARRLPTWCLLRALSRCAGTVPAVTREQRTAAALGLAVGLVLADSSVVILALPDILDQFNVSIDSVAWVLTLFNLVMAIAAVPAAMLSRRVAPGRVC